MSHGNDSWCVGVGIGVGGDTSPLTTWPPSPTLSFRHVDLPVSPRQDLLSPLSLPASFGGSRSQHVPKIPTTWPPSPTLSFRHVDLPVSPRQDFLSPLSLPASLGGSRPQRVPKELPKLSSSSVNDDFWPQISSFPMNVRRQFPSDSTPGVSAFIAGTVSFYSTLALSTTLQSKALRISTGTMPPITTVAGLASVAVGGLVAHGTSVVMTSLQMRNNRSGSKLGSSFLASSSSARLLDFDFDQGMQRVTSGLQQMQCDIRGLSNTVQSNPAHALRIAALALVTFKLLGGRFWSLSPSSFTNLGSFARPSHSLPAKMNYATSAQRKAIESVGRKWGCHTCGSRMIFSRTKDGVKFHADHMPPRSVTERMESRLWRRLLGLKVKQRFYPQCIDCSNVQGGILSKATSYSKANGKKISARALAASGGGSMALNHGFRPRFYHLTGGIIAAATVWDADKREVVRNGNLRRFQGIQNDFADVVGKTLN